MDITYYNGYQAVRSGGYLVILVGGVKRKGVLDPLQRDYRWYGQPVQMLIRLQHNVWSNGQTYTGMTNPRIMREYVIVTRKPMQFAWTVEVRRADHANVDQRGVGGQTLHGIVWTALIALGNQASLGAICEQVKDHARIRKADPLGTDWQAIIRRVLQETCQQVERGFWALPQYVN